MIRRRQRALLEWSVLAVVSVLCSSCNTGDPRAVQVDGSSATGQGGESQESGASLDREERERLAALGYATWSKPSDGPAQTGVAVCDRERAQPGLNVLCSKELNELRFMTNSGEVVHRLPLPYRRRRGKKIPLFQTVAPSGDGSLVVMAYNREVLKIGPRNELEWRTSGRFHHDLDVLGDGELWAIGSEIVAASDLVDGKRLRDDLLGTLDGAGRFEPRLSMLSLSNSNPELRSLVAWARKRPRGRKARGAEDPFHTNSIDVLEHDFTLSDGTVWPRGHILVSVRNVNSVALVDPHSDRLVWIWGHEVLQHQHSASMLESGRVLIFDNGNLRKSSRVIEVDPATNEIVWTYQGRPPEAFYSVTMGTAQRLANGNTLITESVNGRALEVTRHGETVWEYFNEDVSDDLTSRRSMWQVRRLSSSEVAGLDWPDDVAERLRASGFTLDR